MLQSLALALLDRALGRYVKGIDADSLKIGLWTGKIVLEALELKREALFELGLPVNIEAGYIGRIEIYVPWSKLGSEPIRVVIDQVHLIATPIDRDSWTDEERAAWEWSRKQAEIDAFAALRAQIALVLAATRKEQGGSGEGLRALEAKLGSASLLSKMVANLDLTLVGVHVRYEDLGDAEQKIGGGDKGEGSGKEGGCAAGLTLRSVRIHSADEFWKPAFSPDPSMQRKRVAIDELRVYWQHSLPRKDLVAARLRELGAGASLRGALEAAKP
ncbi:N-terminal region of Chorein, a TM vesicle-mediated sorter-domain-containing protein, partial [Pavlovales sp. CCMP2436]